MNSANVTVKPKWISFVVQHETIRHTYIECSRTLIHALCMNHVSMGKWFSRRLKSINTNAGRANWVLASNSFEPNSSDIRSWVALAYASEMVRAFQKMANVPAVWNKSSFLSSSSTVKPLQWGKLSQTVCYRWKIFLKMCHHFLCKMWKRNKQIRVVIYQEQWSKQQILGKNTNSIGPNVQIWILRSLWSIFTLIASKDSRDVNTPV